MKFAYITLFAANTTIPLTSESESNYSAGSDSSGAGLNETHQDLEPEQLMGPGPRGSAGFDIRMPREIAKPLFTTKITFAENIKGGMKRPSGKDVETLLASILSVVIRSIRQAVTEEYPNHHVLLLRCPSTAPSPEEDRPRHGCGRVHRVRSKPGLRARGLGRIRPNPARRRRRRPPRRGDHTHHRGDIRRPVLPRRLPVGADHASLGRRRLVHGATPLRHGLGARQRRNHQSRTPLPRKRQLRKAPRPRVLRVQRLRTDVAARRSGANTTRRDLPSQPGRLPRHAHAVHAASIFGAQQSPLRRRRGPADAAVRVRRELLRGATRSGPPLPGLRHAAQSPGGRGEHLPRMPRRRLRRGIRALATHPARARVSGECFNISGYRYETVGEILSALAAEYGIRGGIVTAPLAEVAQPELRALAAVLSYTQWVDSAKIRDLTGWTDKRRLFSDNTRAYRLAYEAAARAGDAGVKRISERVAGWAALGLSFEKK